jgi:hypothetical protein
MKEWVRMSFISGIALLALLAIFEYRIFALENGYDRRTLRDVESIQVVLLVRVSPEIAHDLLTEQIKMVLAPTLREAGIIVLPQPLPSESAGAPSLVLKVEMFMHQGGYICSITVQLFQDVFLAQFPFSQRYPATTWASDGTFGVIYNLNEVQNLVRSEVQEFIKAYLAAKSE